MTTSLGFSMEKEGVRHGVRPKLDLGGGGADLISVLPDDLLLQILVRLCCARATARTSILSRRWRGLWIRLPDLTFRDVPLGSLQAALVSLQPAVGHSPSGVSLLDICVPTLHIQSLLQIGKLQFAVRVSMLLHSAARLSPTEIHFAVGNGMSRRYIDVIVPRFHRATSIELHGLDLVSIDPRDSFPVLERLSLSGCRVKLTDLILRCPLLHKLRVVDGSNQMSIIIHSTSLREIHVERKPSPISHIDIQAPVLKQLTLSFTISCGMRLCVSILAPSLERVSWWCKYMTVAAGISIWGLLGVRLYTAESNETCSATLQLPHVHVMSLFVGTHHSFSFPKEYLSFTTEIEKHMVTDFSVLELHLVTRGHVFGAFVHCLFRMHRICAATRSLKIALLRSWEKQACPINCPCDEPKNWLRQTIAMTNLERVEIKGFQGEDHEFYFLKMIFRCATMLKRMTVRLSDEVTTSNSLCTKLYDIFNAYPFVECNLDLRPGLSRHSSPSGAST